MLAPEVATQLGVMAVKRVGELMFEFGIAPRGLASQIVEIQERPGVLGAQSEPPHELVCAPSVGRSVAT